MNTTSTTQQGLDQTVKGLIIGVLTWLALKYEVPVEVTVPAMALVAPGLISTVSAISKRGSSASAAVGIYPVASLISRFVPNVNAG